MALISGTGAKVAIDLLRSGRAFRPGGIELFESALKAVQRGEVPEGAVPEFRKLVNSLKAQTISNRIENTRAGNTLDPFRTLQDAFKEDATWWLPPSGLKSMDFHQGRNAWKGWVEETRGLLNRLNIPAYSSWRVDGTGMRPDILNRKLELQKELQYRNHMLAMMEALDRLFGDS